MLTIEQILHLSNRVWNHASIRAELSSLAAAAGLNSEVLVRSVATRWNTVAGVLERSLDMQDVIPQLCDMAQFNKKETRTKDGKVKSTGVRLRRYILNDEEWEVIEQLHRLLDVCLDFLTGARFKSSSRHFRACANMSFPSHLHLRLTRCPPVPVRLCTK